jgi:electron transfer flavoprotein alpha subunit
MNMNNICVFCEIENGHVVDVSLELLSKAHHLAEKLNCSVEALAIGHNLGSISTQIFPYGVTTLYIADDKRLEWYQTLPYTSIITKLFTEIKPQIALMGASNIGRDLGPRVSSALKSGLTADCTELEIGEYFDKKQDKNYENLLYQIRPAFGGNIIATIINPDHRPQMATVREGVMKKEIFDPKHIGETIQIDCDKYLNDTDFAIEIIERHIEERTINIKSSQILVSGGYGVGSKENFNLLFDLADVLGGEVGASRAAVDAGFAEHARQVGQTGVTVRPKLYIACGISGQIQHTAGMDQSAMIIAINNDPTAPINEIADVVINGDISVVIPKMIAAYNRNTK